MKIGGSKEHNLKMSWFNPPPCPFNYQKSPPLLGLIKLDSMNVNKHLSTLRVIRSLYYLCLSTPLVYLLVDVNNIFGWRYWVHDFIFQVPKCPFLYLCIISKSWNSLNLQSKRNKVGLISLNLQPSQSVYDDVYAHAVCPMAVCWHNWNLRWAVVARE